MATRRGVGAEASKDVRLVLKAEEPPLYLKTDVSLIPLGAALIMRWQDISRIRMAQRTIDHGTKPCVFNSASVKPL